MRLAGGDPCPDCPGAVIATPSGGVKCPTCWYHEGPTPKRQDFRTPGQRVLGPVFAVVGLVLMLALWAILAVVGLPLVLVAIILTLAFSVGVSVLVRILRC